MHLVTHRVFAESYQFHIYDESFDHYSCDELAWVEDNRTQYGYLAVDRALYVSTVADLNDHRVRVFLNEDSNAHSFERTFFSIIEIHSGVLVISGISDLPEEKLVVELEPGTYSIQVCSNAIGKDAYSFDTDAEYLEDEEYFTHDEYEHYDIYLSLQNKRQQANS